MEIKKRKFRWIGHVLRKDDESHQRSCCSGILKEIEEEGDQGKGGWGRPRNSPRRSTLREAGRSWSELRYLVADQDKWKTL
jgi:hypothetical protein